MATTRERALDAALALVGEEGIRALTHARVDGRANLPKGSTSNWFRTRDALIAGVVTHLAETERAEITSAPRPRIVDPDDLVDALCHLITLETGPSVTRTRARYTLFLEGAHSPEVLAPLVTQRAIYVEWITGMLAGIGAPPPPDAVRTLMAASDGLILHRVTVDPDAEIRPVIERSIRACLL